MSPILRPYRGRVLVGALVLVAACTPGTLTGESPEDVVSAYEAHLAFVDAWQAEDHEAMSASLSHEDAARWTPARFERVMDAVTEDAGITTFRLHADDVVPPANETGDGSETFDYTVEYRSYAIDRPVALTGELPVVFDAGEDRWVIDWDRSLLLPGVAGARRLALERKWPTRAAILDRRGRKLAVGGPDGRRYPFGAAAGTTIGHIGVVRKQTREEHPDHEVGDLVGESGIEEAFEDRLAGRPRTKLVVLGRKAKTLATLARRQGARAEPLRTTLDIRVQQAAEAAYGSTTGGAVVLAPKTGDILAAVASSPFGPQNYVGVRGIEPFNRALSGRYPPGSSQKVVTAAAALDSGRFKPTTTLTGPAEYRGVRNFESGDFGTLSFAGALRNSVNTAFAQVAEKLGAKRITRYAERFGFNREPAMPLAAAVSSFPMPEDEADLMWGAIGQAQVVATPLQMATVAATIANDGMRMEPRITMRAPKRGERVVARKTARTMTDLMEDVVGSGTGVAAQIPGVRVAGKTGTAEVDVGGERRNHAWFVSFAPAGNPKVAVAVVAEYGGVGGQVAAPLARAILTRVLPLVR